MPPTFLQLSVFLLLGIAIIVLLTSMFRVHAFFALMIACFVVGLGSGIPADGVLSSVKDGFGNIMKSLGLIIVLGTTLGILLEYTGSTGTMAGFILKKTGEKNAVFAMSLTGFIVGLPIFCDSGYIVLSGLNNSLAGRVRLPRVVTSVAMATGLYSVHCLIPPHPGASAAAGVIGVDFGKLMLLGIVTAIPAMLIGYWWAKYAGKKEQVPNTGNTDADVKEQPGKGPSVIKSFIPIVVPIVLVALKSLLPAEWLKSNQWLKSISILGDPAIALAIGVLLVFINKPSWKRMEVSILLREAAEKAGSILVIIGAGGAFGAVLAATKIGVHFSQVVSLGAFGLLFPFLLTFILKTAQGSSTVAIITAASIVQPLLPVLGLSTDKGKLLCVLSMGAGSMLISHANDAYFWVIARFSDIEMRTMFKVYSVATILMGVASLLMIFLLSLVL